jgi:hypothetical protein
MAKAEKPSTGKEFWKKAGTFALIGAVALLGFEAFTDA